MAKTPTLHHSPPSLKYLGSTFYPLDFIYLIPEDNSHLYEIGQILSIPNSGGVQVLKYNRLHKPQGPFGEVSVILVRYAELNSMNHYRLFWSQLLRS